jgi:DNA-binding LytR/AlgR family response regulator
MDIQMPIMDGIQSSIEIRKHLNNLRVKQPLIVAVTGHI